MLRGNSSKKYGWSGRVLLWEDHGCFAGTAGDAEMHGSPAIKICIALDGSFQVFNGDKKQWSDLNAVIIPAGAPHSIRGKNSEMVMILIAPEGEMGQRLLGYSQQSAIVSLDGLHSTLAKSVSRLSGNVTEKSAARFIADAVHQIQMLQPEPSSKIDPRVADSISWIRAGRESGFLVKEIAAEFDLSESRFSHLFTEFARVPVRRYLLWLRLRDALHTIASADSLTDAAHSVGFADSAHLSRTFRNALGIAPTDLVKSSTVVSFLR